MSSSLTLALLRFYNQRSDSMRFAELQDILLQNCSSKEAFLKVVYFNVMKHDNYFTNVRTDILLLICCC